MDGEAEEFMLNDEERAIEIAIQAEEESE